MPKELERDLGLYATVTISIGAMVGSGIFVLPGLAAKIAGPAVVLAYFLAGLVVLPAALSKAEMATAMPEAGGTYLYIDRAMGPLYGTIAGVGAWFSLVFKSAFALVGLGAYLLLFVEVPEAALVFVSLGLGLALVAVNVVGAKLTGRLQAVIVTLVLVALVLFVADGLTYVDHSRYHPFFTRGSGGLLAATGFVFVSYAGVTKIASVAEEVEEPGRNIPLGILLSIAVMMLLYTLVVFVVVGVTPVDSLTETLTPMATAAAAFVGPTGQTVVAAVAVFALVSMANAGILSSARFPLAMSRDDLAPRSLGVVHERFRTPVYAIGFTGAVLLFLVAFVPVVELAKLASAFQILVFTFVNVALVAFRESDLARYDPEFVAPGYPWVQLFGILGGVALLTQMGTVPLVGAVAIVVGGVGWYRVYGRERTEREGAALDAIRRTTDEYSIGATETLLATGGGGGVLVALERDTDRDAERTLLSVAASLTGRRGGRLDAVRFEEVPEQVTLSTASSTRTQSDAEFERETSELAAELGVPVQVDEAVSHEIERGVASYVRDHGMNLVVGEWRREYFHGELVGHDVDWFMRNVDADLVLVQDRGLDDLEEIVVVGDRGPYVPLEVQVADALAREHGARLRFLYAVEDTVTEERLSRVRSYHENLAELLGVGVEWELLRADDREGALLAAAADADLVVASTSPHHFLYDVVFGALPDTLAMELDCTVVLVHASEPRRHTFLRWVLERVAF
ncbi:MAG: APC family permease [Halobacteriaceae archaeon]